MTTIHCAGCTGTDYLGRNCRGHECNAEYAGRLAERERLKTILAGPEFLRHKDVVMAIYKRLAEERE